jgi:hypothetical protein
LLPDDGNGWHEVLDSWDGTLTVVTSSGADGIYSGATLLDVSFDSWFQPFVTNGIDSTEIVVTLQGGKLSSIVGGVGPSYPIGPFYYGYSFDGYGLNEENISKAYQFGFTEILPTPEPSVSALMLASLAGLALSRLGLRRLPGFLRGGSSPRLRLVRHAHQRVDVRANSIDCGSRRLRVSSGRMR